MSRNKYAAVIRAARTKRGISQSDVAEKIGISRPSYIAIEQGKRDITLKEFEKLSSFLGVSLQELEKGESPDYEKYKQMILAFLRLNKNMPKTKLAKLLYFADFGWYYSNLESMSGMQYRKIQYGPVADAYFRLIDEMFDAGEISMEQTENGAMLVSATRSGIKSSSSLISAEEAKLIGKINEKWKGRRTADTVAFTHKQMPYMFAEDNDIVSYDIFTQENPDEIY
ncbi:helix-turn-helix domain-containing protein [Candidatus Parcubacteria bacterium]|nr:MAG: helix-turn-helix domain-containing protein [Candidatus Parcubacteria bacterium]